MDNKLKFQDVDMGFGDSYLRCFKYFFMNFGTMVGFGVVGMVMFPLKLMLRIMYYINTDSKISNIIRLSNENSHFYRKFSYALENMLSMLDRETIHFAAMTGSGFKTSFMKCKQLYRMNKDVILRIVSASKRIGTVGRILIGVISWLVAEFLL